MAQQRASRVRALKRWATEFPAMSPQTEFRYEFFKDAYYFQIERMEGIRERIAFVGGHLLLLGGGIGYLPLHYNFMHICLADAIFIGSVTLAAASFAYSVSLTLYSLARGFKYAFTPPPLRLYEHVDTLVEWNSKLSHSEQLSIEEEMKAQLAHQFAKCADHNLALNTLRSDKLISATKAAIVSSAFLLIASPVFVWSGTQKADTPTVISIPEPIKIQQ